MENAKLFALYEKYLAEGDESEADDDSDIDLSLGVESMDLCSSADSANIDKSSRRKSITRRSSLNSTLATKESLAANVNATAERLAKLQTNLKDLEVPVELLVPLTKMSDEKVTEFLAELFFDFEKKQKEEPAALAAVTKQKLADQLAAMRQIIEREEARFARQMELIEKQNFTTSGDTTVNNDSTPNPEEILTRIANNKKALEEVNNKLKLCKELGFK